ncbi:MAG: glycosyltransferase family 2 protein [Bacteroidia bacterium]|nr:glycosyltransferase family 2 protein [Bacteroidia bacterium]MCZ2277915.1 glycosyltransferase family 2 protein [Bacteroidia bacterium]
METRPLISVVSPVYKAEKVIPKLVERLIKELSSIDENFEIILVDDCCPGNSWDAILSQCQKDKRIKGIKLSRNFGQHYAITAGLDESKGEWVIVMDCDLQDRPEEITRLYSKAKEGYDIVLARREKRQDSLFKKLFSKLFHKTLTFLSGTQLDSTVANFGIYNRKVINAISQMRESIRFFPSMIKWVGFKSASISVQHSARDEGKTSYNFSRLMNLAIDIILAYSDRPIRITIQTGFILAGLAFLYALYNIIQSLTTGFSVSGYASLIISIWFLSGLILAFIGIVGLYVGKTFEGVKNRPIYIIDKKTF